MPKFSEYYIKEDFPQKKSLCHRLLWKIIDILHYDFILRSLLLLEMFSLYANSFKSRLSGHHIIFGIDFYPYLVLYFPWFLLVIFCFPHFNNRQSCK